MHSHDRTILSSRIYWSGHLASFVLQLTNYYQILGVENFASAKEIRKAYISEIKKVHPDLNSSPKAIEKSKILNIAKEALETPAKKAKYDRRLKWHLEFPEVVQTYRRPTNSRTRDPRHKRYRPASAEELKRRKRRRVEQTMKEYEDNLKKYPIDLRYTLCGVYIAVSLVPVLIAVVYAEMPAGIFTGFIASFLFFNALITFVDEYYKYHDYLATKKPLLFDLDKRTNQILYYGYIGTMVGIFFLMSL